LHAWPIRKAGLRTSTESCGIDPLMKKAVLFADDKRRRNKHEQTIFSIIQSVRRFVSRRLWESELS